MSTENNNIADTTDTDLDAFSDEFFGQNDSETEQTNSEDGNDEDVDADAPPVEETGTHDEDTSEDDDTLATGEDDDADDDDSANDDDDGDDDADEDSALKKPKQSRFQKRIDELVAQAREAERREEAANARLAALEARFKQDDTTDGEPNPTPQATPNADAPSPTDKNADGTEKYPLGEFDPQYIKDLVTHTNNELREKDAQTAKEQAEQAKIEAQRAQLSAQWEQKLETAQERYPDLVDKTQQMVDTLGDIDEAYGDYLTATIMSLDNGPDVLYHLANNPEEAKQIIESGAARATIALGRLEAQLGGNTSTTKKTSKTKATKAPAPPPRNKGSSAVSTVDPATDDLDAFEKTFFRGG